MDKKLLSKNVTIHCKLKSVPCTPKCLYTHTFPQKVCVFLCALHTSFFTVYMCLFCWFMENKWLMCPNCLTSNVVASVYLLMMNNVIQEHEN